MEGFEGVERLQTTRYEGLALAPIPQLLVDGAHELNDLRDVRGMVLGAILDKRCTVDEVLAALDAGAVAGTALARRACNDSLRGAVSPPEAELVDGLLRTGVPFYCNVEVWDGDLLLGVADVWLVGTGVGGEMDSREEHGSSEQLDRTFQRDSRFADAGAKLCHVTPYRYRRDPDAFHLELFEQVARRRARGLGDPPGLTFVPRGPLLQGCRRAVPYRYPRAA